MLRHILPCFLAFLIVSGATLAADKQVKAKVVKLDIKKKTLEAQTREAKRVYIINDETKFIEPNGGPSAAGIKDDRLQVGADVELVIIGNGRMLREVHLPEKKKEKDK